MFICCSIRSGLIYQFYLSSQSPFITYKWMTLLLSALRILSRETLNWIYSAKAVIDIANSKHTYNGSAAHQIWLVIHFYHLSSSCWLCWLNHSQFALIKWNIESWISLIIYCDHFIRPIWIYTRNKLNKQTTSRIVFDCKSYNTKNDNDEEPVRHSRFDKKAASKRAKWINVADVERHTWDRKNKY